MKKIKKLLSILLISMTIVSMSSMFTTTAYAATTAKTCAIQTVWGTTKSTYRIKYYTINKNKKVTLDCYINGAPLKNQTSVALNGGKIKNYLKFDVHIIDPQTNRVVKYWYELTPGSTFKVFSAVPGINRSKYTVKVTSYLSNYRTHKHIKLVDLCTVLTYRLKY